MSTPKVRRRLAAAALGCTILLAACGGDETAAGSDGSATGSGSSEESAEGTGSPLEQLFGDGNAASRAVEDAVAACMRERGWQYTPNPASISGVAVASTMDADFSQKYGYGITTQPPIEALGGQISERGDDPNQKYLQTLSEADQQRFQSDLWGAMPGMSAANSDEPVVIEPDPNSCTTKAQQQVAKNFPEMSQEFQARLGELFGSMENDPKMQSALDEWSACMAKQDFVYDTPDEIFSDLSKRQQEIMGGGIQGNGATAGGGAVIIGTNGGSGASAQQPTLSPADQERLTKLQAEELAIAKADTACQKDTIEKVRPELEKEIVEKLRSEFPGLGGGK